VATADVVAVELAWFVRVCVDIALETLTCAVTTRLCGKRNFKRRREQSPYTFFYHCCGCVLWQRLCGHRRQSVPDDDIIPEWWLRAGWNS